MKVLAQVIVQRTSDGPAAFALVAEDASREIVGAIACGPPFNVIDQGIRAIPSQAPQIKTNRLMGISKVVGIAVHEDLQHSGIGSELVRMAEQILKRCGSCLMMFGSCAPKVAPFYRRLGFTLAPAIDLWLVFGFHLNVSTPGELIFCKRTRTPQS